MLNLQKKNMNSQLLRHAKTLRKTHQPSLPSRMGQLIPSNMFKVRTEVQRFSNSSCNRKNVAMQVAIVKAYNQLAQLYHNNDGKLLSIIKRHLKQEKYQYGREIIGLIRMSKSEFFIETEHFQLELIKFKCFLDDFYQQKCIRQIDIAEDSILTRQNFIKDKTKLQQYAILTEALRTSAKTVQHLDILHEVAIMTQNQKGSTLSKVDQAIYSRMNNLQTKVGGAFEVNLQEKIRDETF